MNKTIKKALIAGAGIIAANDLIRLNRLSRSFSSSLSGFKISKQGNQLVINFNLVIVSNERSNVEVNGVRGYFVIGGRPVGSFQGLNKVDLMPGSNSIPIKATFTKQDAINSLLGALQSGGKAEMIYSYKVTQRFLHLLPIGVWIRGREIVDLKRFYAIIKSYFDVTTG